MEWWERNESDGIDGEISEWCVAGIDDIYRSE